MIEKVFRIGCNTVVLREDKVLLGLRKGGYKSGTWGLPGGHLEIGEDLIDAAKRELYEEVGVKNASLKFLSVVEGTRDEAHYIQVNFLLEDYQGEIRLMEPDRCEEWSYFKLEKLPTNLYPPHKKILEAFKKRETYLT